MTNIEKIQGSNKGDLAHVLTTVDIKSLASLEETSQEAKKGLLEGMALFESILNTVSYSSILLAILLGGAILLKESPWTPLVIIFGCLVATFFFLRSAKAKREVLRTRLKERFQNCYEMDSLEILGRLKKEISFLWDDLDQRYDSIVSSGNYGNFHADAVYVRIKTLEERHEFYLTQYRELEDLVKRD